MTIARYSCPSCLSFLILWRRDGHEYRDDANETKLKGFSRDLKGDNRSLILQSKNIVSYVSVCGTTVSGTVFSGTVFHDFLCSHYNVSPLNFQSRCSVCYTASGETHTFSWSTDGLVIAHHNNIRDKVLYLSLQVFAPESVRDKSLIHQVHTRS